MQTCKMKWKIIIKKITPERGWGVGCGGMGYSSLSISAGYELSRHNKPRLRSLYLNLSLTRTTYIFMYIYIDRDIPKTLSLSSFQEVQYLYLFSITKKVPSYQIKMAKKKNEKQTSTTKINPFLCRYIHYLNNISFFFLYFYF